MWISTLMRATLPVKSLFMLAMASITSRILEQWSLSRQLDGSTYHCEEQIRVHQIEYCFLEGSPILHSEPNELIEPHLLRESYLIGYTQLRDSSDVLSKINRTGMHEIFNDGTYDFLLRNSNSFVRELCKILLTSKGRYVSAFPPDYVDNVARTIDIGLILKIKEPAENADAVNIFLKPSRNSIVFGTVEICWVNDHFEVGVDGADDDSINGWNNWDHVGHVDFIGSDIIETVNNCKRLALKYNVSDAKRAKFFFKTLVKKYQSRRTHTASDRAPDTSGTGSDEASDTSETGTDKASDTSGIGSDTASGSDSEGSA